MSKLFLYSSPFKGAFSGTFWNTLHQSLKYIYKTNNQLEEELTNSPLIIVKTTSQKKSMLNWYFSIFPEYKNPPDIFTSDELFTSNQSIWKTEHVDKLIIKKILNANSNNISEKFRNYCKKDGVLSALLSFVEESRKRCLNEKFFETFSYHKNKKDIINILNIFKKEKTNYPTHDIISTLLNEESHDFLNLKKKVNNRYIFILGFWEILPFQKKAFETILNVAKQVSWFIHSHEHDIYNPTINLFDWLNSKNPTIISESSMQKNIQQLELFESKKPQVTCFKANSIEDEIRHCAIQIIELLQKNKNLSCHEIAILYPQKDPYYQLIGEIFKEYYLPVNYVEEKMLANAPLITWLFSIMDLIFLPVTAINLKKCLSDPFSRSININNKAISISSSTLKQYLSCFKPGMTLAIWLEEISKIYKLDIQNNINYSNTFKAITAFFNTITPLIEESYYSDFLEVKKQLFKAINITQYYDKIEFNNHLELKYEYKAITEHFDIFTSLSNTLYPKQKISVLYPVLKDYIKNISYSTRSRSQDGITLLNKSESYGLSHQFVFICGLVTQFWPGKTQDNLFCDDYVKEKLMWPTKPTFFNWDRFLFFSTLYHCNKKAFLSFPEVKGKAPCLPSSLIYTLKNYWGISLEIQTIDTYPIYSESQIQILFPELYNDKVKTITLLKKDHIPIEGHLNNIKSLSKIEKMFEDRAFSATQLEKYQSCPYYFFYDSILKEHKEEDDEDVSPLIWGQLIHNIFHDFLVEMKKNKLQFSNPQHHEKLKDILTNIAAIQFEKIKTDSFFWSLKKELLFGDKGILNLFLNEEINSPLDLHPSHLEHPFDITANHEDGSIKLKGKIDAVLSSRDGKYTAILDYKTGKNLATAADIKHYRTLQLTLYKWAIQKLKPQSSCVGSILYQLKDKHYFGKKIISTTQEGKESVFSIEKKRPFVINEGFYEEFITHLINLKQYILSGKFHYNSKEWLPHMSSKRTQTCQRCPYIYACNYPKRFMMESFT